MKQLLFITYFLLQVTFTFGQIQRYRDFTDPNAKDKERVESINKTLLVKKDSAELYVERGQIVFLLNVNDPSQKYVNRTNIQALADIDKGIQLKPNIASFYKIKADYYFYVNDDFNSAIQNMNKAIELDSTNCIYFQRRALFSYKNNDKNSACLDWKKCLSLDCEKSEECAKMLEQFCQ